MAVSTPNRKCPCGYTKFREGLVATPTNIMRWVRFEDRDSGGLGVTEFGIFFGAGAATAYGLFPGTQQAIQRKVACESCGRVRATGNLGGAVPFGVYLAGNVIYVVASDVTRPVTGYRISAYEPLGTGFNVQLSYTAGIPEAVLASAPAQVSETLPLGALSADTLLSAAVPNVAVTGSYLFSFIDSNSGQQTPLATIFLTAPI